MSFDGDAEIAAIKTRLLSLAGGRVFEGVPDDVKLALNPDGTVKPYIVISAGEPIALSAGRGLGVTEAGQPHSLPVSITSISSSGETTRLLASSVNRLLIGWTPNPPNSGELVGRGGDRWTTINAQLAPSRFFRRRGMECVVGMQAS